MAMTRKGFEKLLLDAGLPQEVVAEVLSSTKDEDLVRMKDMSDMSSEEIVAALASVNKADDDTTGAPPKTVKCPKCGADVPEDATKCPKCGAAIEKAQKSDTDIVTADDDSDDEVQKSFTALADVIVAKIKSEPSTIEVEMPALTDLAEAVTELKDLVTKMAADLLIVKDAFDKLAETDEVRLKDVVSGMSDASKVRLRTALSDAETVRRVAEYMRQRPDVSKDTAPTVADGGVVIKDAQGNTYANLSDFARGVPQKQ